MTARRRSGGGFHGFVAFLRRLVEAFRHDPAGGGSRPGGRGRNPRPQCPACHRFVEELCVEAEDGAEPCGLGRKCCCGGPHLAEKTSQDGGKFKTSAERA